MRGLMSARPLLGSAFAGLFALAVFVAINLAAGEGAEMSIVGGAVVGIAVGGALALAHVLSRHGQPR
jgi:O-antigen/teichoic acid export membrane protein